MKSCLFRIRLLAVGALLCLPAVPSPADILHLKSGKVVEGRVVKEGDFVEVETKKGKVKYPAAMVEKQVEKKTDVDEFYEKLAAIQEDNPGGHAELGQWCMSKNMKRLGTAQFRKCLALDRANLTARVWLAVMEAEETKAKLKKISSGTARALRKKIKCLKVKKLLLELQPRPNTTPIYDLADFDFGVRANLAAKGYEVVDNEAQADAVYRVLYKTGLSGTFEIDGKKHSGMNIQSEAFITRTKDGKEVWKGEVYGFTGAKVRFEAGTPIEEALRAAAIADFKNALTRDLPLSAAELGRRLKATANFRKGALKKMVADLDGLLVDLTGKQIDKYDVLACYGYPDKEECDAGGVNRWIYEEIGLVFEWHHPAKDVEYSVLRILPGYPGTLYGIALDQPLKKVEAVFECKLVSENAQKDMGTFVVTPMPNIEGVTKLTAGADRTVEYITIELSKPPEKKPGAKP